MKKNKTDYGNRIIYKNAVVSMGCKIISACLSLISAPMLLHCLGDEKYGIWVTMLSLVSWIYYCDLGIGNGLRNKLASTIVLGDGRLAKKYLGSAYILIAKISFLVFAFTSIFLCAFDIEKLFGFSIKGEDIRTCLIAALLFACINFVISLVNNVLYALQKAGFVGLFSCCSQSLFILLLGIYLSTGISTILFIAIGEGFTQLIKNIIETIYVFKTNAYLKFSLRDYDKKYTRGILSFGLQMFLVQMAALVLNSTDNLVITKLFGPTAVTPYSICYKYFNMFQMLYVALITPLLSAYTAAYTLKDVSWIYKSLKKNILLFCLFTMGIIIAALTFRPFTIIWLRNSLRFSTDLIVCTVLYFVLLMFGHIFSTFLTGISCIKEMTIATLIGTVVNIPVSIFFARNLDMGASGVILGSAISLAMTVIVAPIISIRELRKMRRNK